KLNENKDINVWLVNTGWSGGAYGTGKRMKLAYTRAMLTAALNGDLEMVEFHTHPVFGVAIPTKVEGVPTEILDPRNTWEDKGAYDAKANHLAELFTTNFVNFADGVTDEILAAAPKVSAAS
ncbi:MAG: phosphoenolpyruvate carboxykinase (ATP), partial [Bacteroidia bacterium]|nr:phosphoenolpyruvate carboxykinase (ATP) [Bacteroidia bacterium]